MKFGIRREMARFPISNVKALMISPPEANIPGQTAAVILSRLPLRWSAEDRWLASARDAVEKIKTEKRTIISSYGSSGWEYITWYAGRVGVPAVVIIPPTAPERLDFLVGKALHDLDIASDSVTLAMPLVEKKLGKEEALHCRDLMVAKLSDVLYPVAIRPGGFWEAILANTASVVKDFQIDYPKPRKYLDFENSVKSDEGEKFPWSDYLVHLTRGAYGPWAGERMADYFAALTEEKAGNPRDELATLTYILNSGILRGSGSVIRGGVPVISFSSLPPYELLAEESNRARLHGAGFQPYGIALPKDLLIGVGAKPVIYGPGSAFKTLPDTDKPFFQARGGNRSNKSTIDWSRESEYRLAGDLDLTSLKEEIVALVPSREVADQIGQIGYRALSLFEQVPKSPNK